MFRFTRTITIKNSHSTQAAMRTGAEITSYLTSKYGMQMRFGAELFGGARLVWYSDTESIDAMTQLNAKLIQDAGYFGLLEKMRPYVVEGSLEDRLVQLVG